MNRLAPNAAPLASLLESRATCLAITGAGVLHVLLTKAHLPGWPCPILSATGIPCPGCGLGRACALLLSGEMGAALRVHAFSPVILLGLSLCSLSAVSPQKWRLPALARLSQLEPRFPFSLPILVAPIIYWLARLALDGPAALPLSK